MFLHIEFMLPMLKFVNVSVITSGFGNEPIPQFVERDFNRKGRGKLSSPKFSAGESGATDGV